MLGRRTSTTAATTTAVILILLCSSKTCQPRTCCHSAGVVLLNIKTMHLLLTLGEFPHIRVCCITRYQGIS